MSRQIPCVMIMAGGTGGHIYPALAVAQHLQAQQIRTVWLGSKKGLENSIVPKHGIKLIRIFVSGLRGTRGAKWVVAPFALTVAVVQSIIALVKERPGAVLGMGGFASGPGGLAAWLCRIPLVIHEQNTRPGTTNRLLSRIATQVFQAFPQTFQGNNVVTVGNPVRAEICALRNTKKTKTDTSATNILVLGGSRGASYLNEKVPAALVGLSQGSQHRDIRVWHQSGENDLLNTRTSYHDSKLDARVDPFIAEMATAYAWADLIICRAGAMTISEVMVAGVASILVPFPYATDDHQTSNAQFLVDQQAAVLVAQGDRFIERINIVLNELVSNQGRLQEMGQRARSAAVFDATTRVSERCQELLNV